MTQSGPASPNRPDSLLRPQIFADEGGLAWLRPTMGRRPTSARVLLGVTGLAICAFAFAGTTVSHEQLQQIDATLSPISICAPDATSCQAQLQLLAPLPKDWEYIREVDVIIPRMNDQHLDPARLQGGNSAPTIINLPLEMPIPAQGLRVTVQARTRRSLLGWVVARQEQ